MHFLNLAPHLLADETIVGMALCHGAQLDRVQRFAQVHFSSTKERKKLLSGFCCARTTKLIGRE
jgi:hypothetical protein